ncbi:tyrosine-type recombinase/integrase [Haloterrigena alkaliphila]|uniref:Tyrosine-type recombinase/integrase n=1 Tax=Haloterrigena alkaliphila TaxID=2816475 RepID=A0A8A2VAN5_9EURY|nr:tyrosine-type recombinase/integrase [Haloterrigena alkaliphila]QSW98166.1 tyrosine-type recombinase/integrase [Haloterrigena alkaliphila]
MSANSPLEETSDSSTKDESQDLASLRSELNAIQERLSTESDLEPITPEEAAEIYLEDRREDLVESTVQDYRRSLDFFVKFCDLEGIDNLNNLSGRTMREYRAWRRSKSSHKTLSPKTMRDEMYLMRNFLGFLEDIEGVETGLANKVQTPELSYEDEVREGHLSKDRANEIIQHLEEYEYATAEHVIWLLLGALGCRRGGVHSLDLEDVHTDRSELFIEFHHRPKGGTTLKNKKAGEREVNVSEEVAEVIDDYIEHNRIEVTDDHGREPLITTTHGRMAKSTISKYIYKWTRPCEIGKDCPHDRDPDECEDAQTIDSASNCPSSQPTHNVRKGYLTAERSNNIPIEMLADRCDVSPEVIKKHYDQRDKTDRRELRQEIYEEVYGDSRGGYLS